MKNGNSVIYQAKEKCRHAFFLTFFIFLIFPTFLFSNDDIPDRKGTQPYRKGNAVTYSFSGGRFGDNLVAYFHAKWIAMKYQLPFLYKPFPLSDQLQMDVMDERWSAALKFRYKIVVRHESEIRRTPASTLYIIPFFPELKYEFLNQWIGKLYFDVDWDDPAFKAEMIRCMTPKTPIPTVPLPQDRKTVGMHVRRGGGYDHKYALINSPLRFPPDSYYIECLTLVLKRLKDMPVYVYLLTDDATPEKLVNQYKAHFTDYPNVEFGCRATGNHYDANVLTDFLTIPKFDCFIGSGSNFSLMATKLGNYEILTCPVHVKVVNNVPFIDQIDIR